MPFKHVHVYSVQNGCHSSTRGRCHLNINIILGVLLKWLMPFFYLQGFQLWSSLSATWASTCVSGVRCPVRCVKTASASVTAPCPPSAPSSRRSASPYGEWTYYLYCYCYFKYIHIIILLLLLSSCCILCVHLLCNHLFISLNCQTTAASFYSKFKLCLNKDKRK